MTPAGRRAALQSRPAAGRIAPAPPRPPSDPVEMRHSAMTGAHYIYNLGLLFERVAEAHAGRPALKFADGPVLTYAALDALSARIARRLLMSGAGRGRVVAVFADKRPETYATMLACLRIGAAYTLLDKASPAERLSRILGKARPAVIVVDAPLPGELGGALAGLGARVLGPGLDLDGIAAGPLAETAEVTGADPAYLMFTSGSTGFPKGAVMTHANVLNFRDWSLAAFAITPADVLSNVNPLYFDNSVFDVYSALFSGAALAPFDRAEIEDARRLVAGIDRAGCTLWFSVPSLLVYLTTMKALGPGSFRSLRAIVFGGEGYPKTELRKLFELYGARAALWNVYGPTECTCICSAYRIGDADFADMQGLAPLGRMAPNFSHLILDGDAPAAPGAVGELCLLGPQVGLGYHNDPERTAAAFVANPLNRRFAERMYRTGDLVRLDPETGLVRFVGRRDNQIKHMGYRIELEEIDAALNGLACVRQAAAVYLRTRPGFGRIMAAAACAGEASEARLLAGLRRTLPAYMIPSRVVIMDALPKNPNGKVDRRALAEMLAAAAA